MLRQLATAPVKITPTTTWTRVPEDSDVWTNLVMQKFSFSAVLFLIFRSYCIFNIFPFILIASQSLYIILVQFVQSSVHDCVYILVQFVQPSVHDCVSILVQFVQSSVCDDFVYRCCILRVFSHYSISINTLKYPCPCQ